MKALSIIVALLATVAVSLAEDTAPSPIDSITKSARDMMPAMPSLPSVSFRRCRTFRFRTSRTRPAD